MNEFNPKKLVLGILVTLAVIIIIVLVYIFRPVKAGATALECRQKNAECAINESGDNCCKGLVCVPFNIHSGNGKCHVLPTPTLTPTPKPTMTPTPTKNPCEYEDLTWIKDNPCLTPTVTPTPTEITPTPGCDEDCVTPTVTPEETVTPTPEQHNDNNGGGGGATSEAHAPAPVTCTIPFSPPVLNSFTAGASGSVTFGWLESEQVDKFSIIYGYSADALIYGEDNIPSSSTSITLNGLLSGHSVFAQVWAFKGGCAEMSNVLDPKVR